MKTIATALGLALVAGCAINPVQYNSPMPLGLDAAFACALRQLNELGYTVTNTDKSAGYLAAERQTRARSIVLVGTTTHPSTRRPRAS
jgi:hypothetical protein